MARLHGRRGRVYLALASGGSAEPVAFQNKWTLNGVTDKTEVTAFDDSNKTYLAGFSDASGAFSGFFDDATAQAYTASQDGIARKFYLYPSTLTNTPYWFGTVFADFSASGGTAQAIDTSSNWNAASPIIKVG